MKKIKLFAGIDPSKEWFDVDLIPADQPTNHSTKQFDNNQKGFDQLMTWITKVHGVRKQTCLFCVENTGLYSLPLCCFLSEKGIDYCYETPLRIKRSMGIKRGKNDQIDARIIAQYVYLHKELIRLHNLPSEDIIDLKALLSFRERLKRQKHALQVSAKELKGFTKASTHQYITDNSEDLIKLLKEKLKQVQKQIVSFISSHPELKTTYDLATSVKGIGMIIAAYMIVYTGNFTNFDKWRRFACYCGSAPFSHKSGTSIKGKDRVSHLANKFMKSLLTNGAYSAIQHDPELKAYFKRKLVEGKQEFLVINNVRCKLISRVFAAVTRGTPYVQLYSFAA